MGKINQVVVNGQNYEVEDKVARNYYPDTEQVAAIAEENSYKIVDKNGNVLAEFKSDSDISIMLGGGEENAILKLTKNKVEIGNENTEINIKGLYENLKYNNNEIGLILEYGCAKLPGDNKNIIYDRAGNGIIFGYNNLMNGPNSLIGGTDCSSGSSNVLVFGKQLTTGKEGQVVIGEYNYRVYTDYDYYSFTIGGGNSDEKSNLIHINKKGSYFKGIGGYEGKEFTDCKSLQDIISNFETRIAALEKNSIRTIFINTNIENNKITKLIIDDKIYETENDIKEAFNNIDYRFCKLSNKYYSYPCFILSSNNNIVFTSINKTDNSITDNYVITEHIINISDLSLIYSEKYQ